MPIRILAPYRLTGAQRTIIQSYLNGEVGPNDAAAKLGMSRQRLYTICALILRHSCSAGTTDAKALLAKY